MKQVQVGDWVKLRHGRREATAPPMQTIITEVKVTWRNGDEVFVNGYFYQAAQILEVRPPAQEAPHE